MSPVFGDRLKDMVIATSSLVCCGDPVFYRTRKGSLMDTSSSDRPTDASGSTSSRRDFLHQAAGIATGIAAMTPSVHAAEGPASTSSLLPTIQLGPHRVTRLIIGGNPIYGY